MKYRVTVALGNFSTAILGRTKCTYFTPTCLEGSNICIGCQLSMDREMDGYETFTRTKIPVQLLTHTVWDQKFKHKM